MQDGLKTGRVMVKDEDVCLHCGMCAERCPTGAWDMQKFLLEAAKTTLRPAAKGSAAMPQPLTATNDFVVKFANVNGSGSASANRIFARSILRMGVPIASRNIFPSNIQGLPTWFEVRVSGEGHLGRRGGVDLMVAMNPQTWDRDLAEIEPGGYLFYDSTKPLPPSRFREDVTVIGVPLTAMCNAAYTDARQRQLFKNIIYVGALSALLGIEPEAVETLLGEQYKGKEKLAKANHDAFRMGRDWALDEPLLPDRPAAPARRRRRRPHLRGRQQRRRPRRGLWRRHRLRLVPDHALHLARRGLRALLPAVPHRSRRRARSATPSCRPRTSWPPSAW